MRRRQGATANNQTFRSIVKPDLWGRTMRVKFSNVFGNQPLTLNAVTLGLQEYAANLVKGSVVPGQVPRLELGDDPARAGSLERRRRGRLGR
jgi:hypothetical protein